MTWLTETADWKKVYMIIASETMTLLMSKNASRLSNHKTIKGVLRIDIRHQGREVSLTDTRLKYPWSGWWLAVIANPIVLYISNCREVNGRPIILYLSFNRGYFRLNLKFGNFFKIGLRWRSDQNLPKIDKQINRICCIQHVEIMMDISHCIKLYSHLNRVLKRTWWHWLS